jgi:YD repeat-containing protein
MDSLGYGHSQAGRGSERSGQICEGGRPEGVSHRSPYDALNRLSTVTDPSTGKTSYTYDAVGNLQSVTYPNGVAHSYQAARRPDRLRRI